MQRLVLLCGLNATIFAVKQRYHYQLVVDLSFSVWYNFIINVKGKEW